MNTPTATHTPRSSLRKDASISTHLYTSATMTTYTDSVIDAADDYGNLSLADAKHLFAEHGNDYWQAHELDGMPLTLNAVKLLNWLGY